MSDYTHDDAMRALNDICGQASIFYDDWDEHVYQQYKKVAAYIERLEQDAEIAAGFRDELRKAQAVARVLAELWEDARGDCPMHAFDTEEFCQVRPEHCRYALEGNEQGITCWLTWAEGQVRE